MLTFLLSFFYCLFIINFHFWSNSIGSSDPPNIFPTVSPHISPHFPTLFPIGFPTLLHCSAPVPHTFSYYSPQGPHTPCRELRGVHVLLLYLLHSDHTIPHRVPHCSQRIANGCKLNHYLIPGCTIIAQLSRLRSHAIPHRVSNR